MFSSYDFKQFGDLVKQVRTNLDYSQKEISNLTGIHVDTLRRIENGMVIPKYETLELLSIVYKTDLVDLLQLTKSDTTLSTLYAKIDSLISSNNVSGLANLKTEFEEIVEICRNSNNLVNNEELSQLELFMEAANLFYTENQDSLSKAESILTLALFSKSKYEIDKLPDNTAFSHLEIRLLILLAMIKMLLEKHTESLNILISALEYLTDKVFVSSESIKMIIRIHLNISYCYHMISENTSALHFANSGIVYANQNDSSFCLYALFARKGVAEFILGRENYMESLQYASTLLKIGNKNDLLEHYRNVCKRLYDIELC